MTNSLNTLESLKAELRAVAPEHNILALLFDQVHPGFRTQDHESLWIATFTASEEGLQPGAICAIKEGDSHSISFGIQALLDTVLQSGYTHFALAHNHPRGVSPVPSIPDLLTHAILLFGAQQRGIEYIDHLILSEDAYFSMADEGCQDIDGILGLTRDLYGIEQATFVAMHVLLRTQ